MSLPRGYGRACLRPRDGVGRAATLPDHRTDGDLAMAAALHAGLAGTLMLLLCCGPSTIGGRIARVAAAAAHVRPAGREVA